jgi:arabinogalactan endo-1,4-beta-galactosidase
MPGESKFQYISELIKQDFTSGYYPFWNLSISDLSESSIEHIANCVARGFASGEIVEENDRGWWEIKF